MTIVIPTFRRRAAVLRLLDALAPQVARAGAAIDVLVVVDGSDDGTVDAVRHMAYPAPLEAVFQDNAGPAAARNRGLAQARGDLVWFVDDDMIPTEDLLERHLAAHPDGRRHLLMGPCLHPPDVEIAEPIRAYAAQWFSELARTRAVTRAFDFSAANTSGPAEVWRGVGGFEERLRGWGGDDYEIGLRLLHAGVEIAYDPDAVAWHLQVRTIREFCANKRDQGRNLVRISQLHAHAVDDLLPRGWSGRVLNTIRRVGRNHPAVYGAAARILAVAASVEGLVTHGRRTRLLSLADVGNQLAGVAEMDPDGRFVARYFHGRT